MSDLREKVKNIHIKNDTLIMIILFVLSGKICPKILKKKSSPTLSMYTQLKHFEMREI
jgi:hypothetical protein